MYWFSQILFTPLLYRFDNEIEKKKKLIDFVGFPPFSWDLSGRLRIIIEDFAGVDFSSDIIFFKMISPKTTFSRCHFIFFQFGISDCL